MAAAVLRAAVRTNHTTMISKTPLCGVFSFLPGGESPVLCGRGFNRGPPKADNRTLCDQRVASLTKSRITSFTGRETALPSSRARALDHFRSVDSLTKFRRTGLSSCEHLTDILVRQDLITVVATEREKMSASRFVEARSAVMHCISRLRRTAVKTAATQ